MQRAVLLARYTGQRQADVLRMGPGDIEDGGIVVVQQKTGKELWVPLHPNAWAGFMTGTPAGRIRDGGFRVPRASRIEL